MPAAVGGWCAHCWGLIGGVKFYILGVAGYNTPIWDVLVLRGEREEAGECLHGAKFENYVRIRKPVPVGLPWARICSWARWARIFITKNMYYSRYSVFIPIKPIDIGLGRWGWMDGKGWVWMTL